MYSMATNSYNPVSEQYLGLNFNPNQASIGSILAAGKAGAGTLYTPSFTEKLSTDWNNLGLGGQVQLGLNTVGGLMNAYNAYKANKLAKDQLNFQKDTFYKNFEAQRKMTNSQLEDRQKSRLQANPNIHTSVNEYMKKYGV